MKHCKLRIAWSVTWGVVAAFLCMMWVRSHWWDESVIADRNALDRLFEESLCGSVADRTGYFSTVSLNAPHDGEGVAGCH
jgi:hypothetical protein